MSRNQHVARNKPRWQKNPPYWLPIRGLTLLFNASKHCFVNDDKYHLRKLHYTSEDKALALFDSVHEAISSIEVISRLIEKKTFMLVPLDVYHVTAMGLFHEENVRLLSEDMRSDAAGCLHAQPGCEEQSFPDLMDCLAASGLLKQQFTLEYEYDSLALFSTALVARLRPAAESSKTYQLLEQERDNLSSLLHTRFGTSKLGALDPHITVGYFASPEDAQAFLPSLDQIQIVNTAIQSKALFNSIGLYSYTDMVHFFRNPLL